MRLIVGLLLLLLGIGWLASEIELTAAPSVDRGDTGWRRTCDGWERQNSWADEQPVRQPALHPTLLGSLQILFSVAALIALPGPDNRYNRPVSAGRPRTRTKSTSPRNSRNGSHRFVQHDVR